MFPFQDCFPARHKSCSTRQNMRPNDFSGARVLVTGGAGFIGSALVWALNRRGCDDVLVCDRLGTDEKWRNLTALKFADYVEADDLLPRLQSGALGKFDLILHLGACSSTTERDASFLIRNNFEYTKDLAAWALHQKARGRKTRFVYASSAATYGDGSAGMADDDRRLQTLRPMNMYGYSKHLFDLYARRSGFLGQIVGLKYFNVFGPNEHHKGDMRSLVHKSFGQVRDTGVIHLFKSYRPDYRDGGQKRDFLYVKDAVAMTLHLAATPKAGGLYQYRRRAGPNLAGLGAGGLCRPRTQAQHRVHRNARSHSRPLPILHPSRPGPFALNRLPRARHLPRRRHPRLCPQLPRPGQTPGPRRIVGDEVTSLHLVEIRSFPESPPYFTIT